MKVYGIDSNNLDEDFNIELLDNEQWVLESERQGLIWSIKGFESFFNDQNIDNIYIRFLED